MAVDGLKPSKYLIDTVIKNIEGNISIDEAQELLNSYYEENAKVDIRNKMLSYTGTLSEKTIDSNVIEPVSGKGKGKYIFNL